MIKKRSPSNRPLQLILPDQNRTQRIVLLFLLSVFHTTSIPAAEMPMYGSDTTVTNDSSTDCMAIGEWNSREECFSTSVDYADCADNNLRCSPYKKMYVARKELEALELQVALFADQLYGGMEMWDREYLADLKDGFREANAAWSEYRDKKCLAEQFISGTTRGNQMGDLTESCRLDATNDRIMVLKIYTQALATLEAMDD